MKKYLALILSLVLIASLLAGCGAATGGEAMKDSAAALPNADNLYGNAMPEGSAGNGETLSESPAVYQKLIRKVTMSAETDDLDTLMGQIDQRVRELSGYMENREVYNGSKSNTRRYRYAHLTIRVPVDKLDTFVNQVAEISNITSTNETAEDITLTYVATESRVKALETEQARLLELLAKAETMDDLLKIESRLTEVRTDLEEVTSQLRLYDNLVDYATLKLDITEVKEYTVVEEPETIWDRIGKGFMESLEGVGNFFTELFVFLIVASPYLALLALYIVIVVLLAKLANHSFRKKKKK